MSTDTPGLNCVPTPRTIDTLATCPDWPEILVASDDALFTVDEQRLAEAGSKAPPLDLSQSADAREVATAVEAWSLEPTSRTLAYVREGAVELVDLTEGSAARRVPPPNLRGNLVAVLASHDQGLLLCVTTSGDELDLGRYNVEVVDAEKRQVVAAMESQPTQPPQCAWSAATKSFLVFDRPAEAIWRFRAGQRVVERLDLRMASDQSAIAMHLHPQGTWIALLLEDQGEQRSYVLPGSLTKDGVDWQGAAALPDGLVRVMCWHPTERKLAFERTVRWQSVLEIVSMGGAVTQSRTLPPDWLSHDLAWSRDGSRLFVAGPDSVGVWKV